MRSHKTWWLTDLMHKTPVDPGNQDSARGITFISTTIQTTGWRSLLAPGVLRSFISGHLGNTIDDIYHHLNAIMCVYIYTMYYILHTDGGIKIYHISLIKKHVLWIIHWRLYSDYYLLHIKYQILTIVKLHYPPTLPIQIIFQWLP